MDSSEGFDYASSTDATEQGRNAHEHLQGNKDSEEVQAVARLIHQEGNRKGRYSAAVCGDEYAAGAASGHSEAEELVCG
jgi:hypothetical protein